MKKKKHLNLSVKGTLDHGRLWSEMVGIGRKWSKIVGNGRKWSEMVGNGQKSVVVEVSGWTWSKVVWGS